MLTDINYIQKHRKRIKETADYVYSQIDTSVPIIDLGTYNSISHTLHHCGYTVTNTHSEDLDIHYQEVHNSTADVMTAFEVLEHMVNPMQVLKSFNGKMIIGSVPIRGWGQYRGNTEQDPHDEHYHEFREWELRKLLNKSGYKIVDIQRKHWPTSGISIRKILKRIIPSHYLFTAIKK